MNVNLLDELTTQEELSGLLNFAVEGYIKLIKQNKFSNNKNPEETKFLMIQNGNSLAKFSNEVLINVSGSKVDKEKMYQTYCNWCRSHKPQLSPDSKDKIGKSLTKFASYTQASSNGKERYWLNVKINNGYDTNDTNLEVGNEDIPKEEDNNNNNNDIYDTFSKTYKAKLKDNKDTNEDTNEDINKNDILSSNLSYLSEDINFNDLDLSEVENE